MKKMLQTSFLLLGIISVPACTTGGQLSKKDVGTIAGGVAGGYVGNTLTGGSTLGTIGGTLGGAYIGREVARNAR